MRLPHRLQGQKVKSQSHGAGTYCGGHLAAQLVNKWVDGLWEARIGHKATTQRITYYRGIYKSELVPCRVHSSKRIRVVQ